MYFGSSHFTSCIISNNNVWFHDGVDTGADTGADTEYEGPLSSIGDLLNCQEKKGVSCAICTSKFTVNKTN
jgi:hypothetical protein